MKLTAEVEIDWIDEDGDINEEVSRKLTQTLANSILEKFSDEQAMLIAQRAKKLIEAKTEMVINTLLEQPITITHGWNKKTEYDSIMDMVEQEMTALYQGKLNSNGQCKEDPLLANIKSYVKTETDSMLKVIDKKLKDHAHIEAKKAVNSNELIKAIGYAVTDIKTRRGTETVAEKVDGQA
ncbi:MAG: hypothetical protein DBP02_01950 [gamma proteobacterium symbiont of Ctena orbiculata]|nr:MAG: hypothetical protein DBP02_01950 [gamma proteobacterium symbiont of Ctena orbiculata]